MGSFNFYYRSSKERANLSVRFIHKDLDYVLRSPFVSNRSYWYKKTTKNSKARVVHLKVENLKGDANLKLHKSRLLEFKEKLETQFINDLGNGVAITKNWFLEAIAKNHSIIEGVKNTNEAYQKELKQKEIEEQTKKLNLLKNSLITIYEKYGSNLRELKKFKTTYKWVSKFETFNKKVYDIIHFNQQFVDSFKSWATHKENYKLSTTVGHLKRIKRAIDYVYSNDSKDVIVIHKQLTNLRFIKSNELEKASAKIVVILNFDELDKIDNLDFHHKKSLEEAQKSILLGCETGLRFSDFNKLNDSNLRESIDGVEYWEFKTRKTNKWVQIPKTKRLKYLIDKYGEPKTIYKANDDIALNKNIKLVCLRAGFKDLIEGDLTISEKNDEGKFEKRLVRGMYPKYKLMTTRTFRRSFATNYYGKINISHIMKVTGHTTEKMLRAYINVTDDRNVSLGYESINEFHKERNEKLNLR